MKQKLGSVQSRMKMDFIAVDVETANHSLSSICQIGLASFRNGRLQGEWKSLINPEDYFDPMNISIHGITEEDVQSAPIWIDVYYALSEVLNGEISLCHTAFDRVSTTRACARYELPPFNAQWLDSARVVRRAWPVFARSGYGLSSVAAHLGIEYSAHDAGEDARCAGEVLLRAIADTGMSAMDWVARVRRPIDPRAEEPVLRLGNPEGPLYGEVLVFTGALSLRRSDAADLADIAGCEVDARVTERTSLLVVGDQDLRKLAGHEKSSKHRHAEDLIAKGHKIRIIGETDFQKIIEEQSVSDAVTMHQT